MPLYYMKNSNIIWIGGQAFFTNIKLQPDQAREGESLYNCNVIESDDFLIPPLIIKVVGTSEAKQRHEKITARKIALPSCVYCRYVLFYLLHR